MYNAGRRCPSSLSRASVGRERTAVALPDRCHDDPVVVELGMEQPTHVLPKRVTRTVGFDVLNGTQQRILRTYQPTWFDSTPLPVTQWSGPSPE